MDLWFKLFSMHVFLIYHLLDLMKLVFSFALCILYKSSNFQANAIIQTYLRKHFIQQSKKEITTDNLIIIISSYSKDKLNS